MSTNSEIIFLPFRLDVAAERLWREQREIPLRPQTFAILRYLAEPPSRLISKDELLRTRIPFSSTIHLLLAALRKARLK